MDGIKSGGRPQQSRSANTLLITIDELAHELRVSRAAAWKWLAAGKLPRPIRLGDRCPRWRRADIEQWLANGGRVEN